MDNVNDKTLSKANILDKVNQYDIFKCYCTPFTVLNKSFKSELREDKRPTCSIGKYRNNLLYKDFTEVGTLNCFDYMMKKYNITFIEALQKVNIDFSVGLESFIYVGDFHKMSPYKTDFNIKNVAEFVSSIRVCVRNWNIQDKAFWNGKYYLTSTILRQFEIYPLSGFYINGAYTECGSAVYGYYFGRSIDGQELWKIYQPYADKDSKWRTNCTDNIIQGLKQLPETGELLLITKSLKDVVVLNSCQFSAIAPQAESNNINPLLIESLKKRFKTVLLLYDNDNPGIKASEKISQEHDLKTIFMPDTSKDASDFIELYGREMLINYLNSLYEIHGNNS